MRKFILSIMAVMSITAAMAQGNRPQFDPQEMIQRRTQEMTETYNLTAEQAEKVKALNEKFMGKMGRPHGPRPEGMGNGQRPERPEGMGNGERPERPEMPDSIRGKRPEGGRHGGRRGGFMEEYNKELKTILTAEQYKAYEEDQAKRMQQMGRRRNRE